MPLHSRYILRSRSARVSSEALRWWVTLVTPFFFVELLVVAIWVSWVLLAQVIAGLASKQKAIATGAVERAMRCRESRTSLRTLFA